MPKAIGKKIRSLNCMGNDHYGSIESIESLKYHGELYQPQQQQSSTAKINNNSVYNTKKNPIGLRKAFSYIKRKSFRSSKTYRSEYDRKNEKTKLLCGKKVKYSALVEDNDSITSNNTDNNKKSKKNVRFLEDGQKDQQQDEEEEQEGKKKSPKKKAKSFLKRTGKIIVRSCRLMSYGAPYMPPHFPYNNRYPSDFRNYDFETGQFDYGQQHYYNYGDYPTMFF